MKKVMKTDEILARVLLYIAISIMPCVQMEADWPSKNADRRMPILDMKVWIGREWDVIYSHYEKPVSSKTVLHSRSAHPSSCKISVHTQEILRRMLNCSKKKTHLQMQRLHERRSEESKGK